MRQRLATGAVIGLLAACSAEPAEERVPDRPATAVLAGVPVFPLSTPAATDGTSEALAQLYLSAFAVDTVASWYRRNLLRLGWEILSDHRAPDRSVTLVAQRGGSPIWVMINPRPDGTTAYRLIGVTDSASAGRR
jgi:hypothetical protein